MSRTTKLPVALHDMVHPSRGSLARFAAGRLGETELQRIENHLDQCGFCCESLAELSPRSDGFVARLVQAATSRRSTRVRVFSSTDGGRDQRARPPSAVSLPQAIGHFQIRREIGQGGFGVVLLADDLRLQRSVAVKIPRPGLYLTEELRERFLREARVAAALDHRNIVPIYAAGEANGVCYIASSYCRGPNLSDWLSRQNQPVSFKTAAHLVQQLADAVAHAHARGVLHRDLKPSNILLQDASPRDTPDITARSIRVQPTEPRCGLKLNPKITDFGLAKLNGDRSEATLSNVVMGTAGYMSPEQARGKANEVSEATDIYSLGAIFYQLLTGRRPIEGDSDFDTLQRLQSEEPISPARLRPKLPRDLATICMKCLEKEPHRRYSSARALHEDLHRYLEGRTILARPASRAERWFRSCRRKPALAILVASVVLLLITLLAGSIYSALSIRAQQRQTLVQLERAKQAKATAELSEQRAEREERAAKHELFSSLLAEARATRMSGRAGHRLDSMRALEEAASLSPMLDLSADQCRRLRNEVIACIALTDLQLDKLWSAYPSGTNGIGIALDTNMQRYAKIDADGRLVVRRMEDNQEVWSTDIDAPLSRKRSWWLLLRFSPDGNYLLARGYHSRTSPGYRVPTRVWDMRTNELILDVPPGRSIQKDTAFDFDFSPDSQSVAVANEDGSVSIIELHHGSQRTLAEAGPSPSTLRYDPSGARLAVSANGKTRILDISSGEIVLTLDHESKVIGWSADGKRMAIGVHNYDVGVWNADTGQHLATCSGHQAEVVSIGFLKDSYTLATTSWADTRLWNSLNGQQLLMLEDGNGRGFSGDRRWLGVGGSGPEVGRFTLTSPTGFTTLGKMRGPLEISPNGRLLLAADGQQLVFWDLFSGRRLESIILPHVDWNRAWFDDKGESLMTASKAGFHRWPIRWNETRKGRGVSDSEKTERSRKISIGPARFLPLARPMELQGVLPTCEHRVLVSTGKEVRMLDLCGDETDIVHRIRHSGWWMAASNNLRWLARSRWHKFGTDIWDLQTDRRVHTFDGINARMEFSPSSEKLVIGNPDRIDIFETDTWRLLHSIESVDMGVGRLVSFSRDGRFLVTAPDHETITLLNGETFEELASFDAPGTEMITAMCLSLDGRQLVAQTASGIVHAWDLSRIQSVLAELGLNWQEPLPDNEPTELTNTASSSARGEVELKIHLGQLNDIQRLSGLIEMEPQDAERHVQRGQAYEQFGLWTKALDDFTTAVELDPKHAEAHFQRGRLLARHSRHQDAVDALTCALQLAPDHAQALYHRAQSQQVLHGWGTALADYSRAAELDPNNWESRQRYGTALHNTKKWDEALESFSRAIELAIDDWDRSESFISRARTRFRLGHDSHALADAELAFQLDEYNCWRSNELAWGLATVSDPAIHDPIRAVKLARHSLNLYRENGMAWNTLGVAYYRQGDYARAVEAFHESLKLRGGDSFDWFFLAMIRWQWGDEQQAQQWLDKAIAWMNKHKPHDIELRRFRAEAEAVLDQGQTVRLVRP